MKRVIAAVILLMIIGTFLLAYKGQSTEEHTGFTTHRVISHAMGAVDGLAYTNAREAFVENYKKGSRVFEVDLMFTSDGHLVARHEWTESFTKQMQQEHEVATEQGGKPWSYHQFKNTPIHGSYTPLDWKDVLDLLENYPDAYIVTDTKEQDPAQIKQLFAQLTHQAQEKNPELLSRIVPQIYNEEMLQTLRSIYPYTSIIYTLYATEDTDDQIIQFVQQHDITAVTLPENRVSGALVESLRQAGAVCYVNTINELKDATEYEQMGVRGFYTDVLTEKELRRRSWLYALRP
ncbi:phosphatidylinositol-specific phospholipase C/glycerophosphodiester phosphodiesterase family protein [Paenibacillus polymyxa]|uniref:phosphatidylinositol-specific phospholipase C/glycerophosphodiester phosphodiesterase family protein n=1 Tax=Paenibacillus polymyxa TaxID=1406 RepID=UPI0025B6C61C|nr:phosphatidylinositol-specific phospholipase C/glycerophosphodiester phosphodiesterase family protein [Paenibacillus polymyxa]MDN4079277.1 phosphatidylinositol-specific phospholipase C/glycerophosphodiester phosphodiesterase family protein [Paenibacillus polymyxa]MDN4104696.1 phosphatidylinositol-specific phospholipase C/glycerophosphodiester phosphodiesterase family protein [Paenibacillus polymyxa]MDN4114321.1 phosphatidylinositol-specific phospholipase C/glycerophosphodiester phosphodiestera